MLLRILPFLALAFKVWMFSDALRRRVPQWWYVVIWLPFGAIAYFALVKSRDYHETPVGRLLRGERPPSVAQLEARYDGSPSLENLLDLARAKYDHEQYEEASATFEQVLTMAENDLDARFGLALSRLALADWAGAISHLERVVEAEPSFEQYEAWAKLAYARHADGDPDGCIAELRRLVDTSPRLNHQVYLAHYLREADRADEAAAVLREGLAHHDSAPPFLRKHNRTWAKQARSMLKELSNSRTDRSPPPKPN